MNRDEILEILRAHRDELRKRFGVKSLAVFGSVARGEAGPDSDVDILVEFDPQAHVGLFKMVELKEFLEKVLGCPVDVVTLDGLRPWMRELVRREAVRIRDNGGIPGRELSPIMAPERWEHGGPT